MSGVDLDEYGELKHGAETDITYRVRNDGKFVALFDPNGDDLRTGLRIEDIQKISEDPDIEQ